MQKKTLMQKPSRIETICCKNPKSSYLLGKRYWRYTGFKLDPGYPKRLKGWYIGLQAALQEDNGEIRVLKV